MTSAVSQDLDDKLSAVLTSYAAEDIEFWSFRGRSRREHTHAFFQYPAMMVPRMQGQLIKAVREVQPNIQSVFDPFVGSGTVMTEAMLQGLHFLGYDINPLAILLCRAKMGPFDAALLFCKTRELIERMHHDQELHIEIHFMGLDKWFRQDVAADLSRIVRTIRHEPELWARRFFWVALAETVRLTSNSRTSTFKLHMRPVAEIERRCTLPSKIFEDVLSRNLDNMEKQREILAERGLLEEEHYKGNTEVHLCDVTKSTPQTDFDSRFDLLVTSPPYGDNNSTVTYGQHSYLPLQWIDFEDIEQGLDCTWIANTHAIDRRSLGGIRADAREESGALLEISPSFRSTLELLRDEPADRAVRVAAFFRDLDRCINPILARLKPNAYMFWTVGNRMVAGRAVPIDSILVELLASRGAKHIISIQRAITPQKRMALKNRLAQTMRAETILVLRKDSA